MWFTRMDQGFRGWFAAVNPMGTLATGLSSSSFTITVRNPADTASSTPSAIESGKPGLYRFDVTSSYFLTHGTGDYGVVIEVTNGSNSDVLSNVLSVYQHDFDTLLSSSISISSSSIQTLVSATWDANMSSHILSGTAGVMLRSASLGPTPTIDYQQIATSVWNEQLSLHTEQGSTGLSLSQVSGTISLISSSVGRMSGTLGFLYDINFGRWRIISNEMIFYKDDNATEIVRFALKDSAGAPTMESVFERVKI